MEIPLQATPACDLCLVKNMNVKGRKMSEENTSIHDFDFKLICEYFSNLERQGPGSPEETLKALSFVGALTNESKIADIGCGTGGQTMV
ncbi:MAG: hypothetical protein WBB23_11770, partial [Desulforhopalus sp.]